MEGAGRGGAPPPISGSGAGHGRPPDAVEVGIDGPRDEAAAGRGRGAPGTGSGTTGVGRGRGNGLPALGVLGRLVLGASCNSTGAGAAKKRFKNADLKNYFSTNSCSSSGTDSSPSTHEDERNPGRAGGLVRKMESFSFVFNMKLMLKVLCITNELSLLLQRKDQNIVQAMSLLIDVKARLVTLRNEGWEPLFEETKSFCVRKHIPIPNMDEPIPRWGRSRLDGNLITQEHHYRVDTFYATLDAIITELDHRFNEVSSELLVCIACLDPRDSFSRFDIEKIARLTEIYDQDFSIVDRSMIRDQLETFILHVRRVDDFIPCHDLGSFAIKMVETEKHLAFPLVYRLIELALLLPVATTSVERAFSAMKIIKTDLRNRMKDEWLNDLILCYIEKEIFRELDYDKIKKTFQAMEFRKMKLPRPPRRHRHA